MESDEKKESAITDSELEENLEVSKEEKSLEEEMVEDKVASEEKIFEEKEKTKNSGKQKKIIIGIVVALVVLIITIILIFCLNKKDNKESGPSNSSDNSNKEDYQQVLNQYGEKLEKLVVNYLEQNGKLPDLTGILDYAKIGDYKITCKEQSITIDKKIYLGECRINDSSETYSYGVKEGENPIGETLTIYRGESPNYVSVAYLFSLNEEEKPYFKEIATVPCKKDKCQGRLALEQYAIVSEDDYLYVYDYENKKYLDIEIEESLYPEYLVHNQKMYGIYYEKDNKDYLYSIGTGKTFKVTGSYYESMGWTPDVMLPLGYAPLTTEEGTTYFVNLTTGKNDFSMNQVGSFEVDSETNKVYILTFIPKKEGNGEISHRYKIYDSKGLPLFNGEEFESFYVENGTFVTTKEGSYKVYNANYQNTYTSSKYSDILSIWNEFILVVDGTNLNLINYQEDVLTTFVKDWSEKKYYYHSMLSGWYTENGKNGIYLIIQQDDVPKSEILKNNPGMTEAELDGYDFGYEYYYIPTTKESGKIATFIGGYAKPVLYLYPILPTMVTVKFQYPNNLTTTYPKYKDSWEVFANPDGSLYDLNNKYYYALYWEERENHRVDFREGFYVTKENAIEFLEEKLTQIGLSDRERNEFIMYWLPVLEKNEKSLVYFELTEERNNYSPIQIKPMPNSMLRIAIHIKKVDKPVPIKEQKLPTFERKGFTAVEWGGVIY